MKANTQNIIPTLNELLKLEHLVASTGFSLLPKQPVHSILAGKHASKLRGRGLDFEEVRKYVPGDDIRNIDWRVTARTGITSTKVFNFSGFCTKPNIEVMPKSIVTTITG